jgi:transcription termination/antitermination protein NusA
MQTDFMAAIKQIAAERGIDVNEIVEAIKQAIRVGFKRDYPDEMGSALQIELDPEKGTVGVFADKKVVDVVTNEPTQISLADAKRIEPKLKEGDHVLVEITQTGDFGRVAAQAAKQVILQKIKESEKEAMVKQFTDKIGTVDSAVIQRMDREGNVICEIYRAIAIMPPEEQIGAEFYKSGSRIKVFLKKIHSDLKGKTLIVSRADKNFLKALFEMEVPEIASGTVEIMEIAREPGSRSKVAVRSNAAGVDPIGSCVGQRGSRINAITNELKAGNTEEKIDIIPWDEDIATFIGNAIRPADSQEVRIISKEGKQALIIVNDEFLSLAIGREGQNVRLASKLTGWNLDIQGKQMYEDNGKLSRFEMEGGRKPAAKPKAEAAETEEKEAVDNEGGAFAGLEISARVLSALEKADINSVEDLKAKLEAGEKIKGVGDKAVEELKAALNI